MHSVLIDQINSIDQVVERARETARDAGFAAKGEVVAITAGTPFGVSGTTNFLKLAVV